MKKFPLARVLDYRTFLRQEKRHALAEAVAEERKQVEKRQQLAELMERELFNLAAFTREGSFQVEAAARRRYFTGQIEFELLKLDQLIHQLNQVVEVRRGELVEADREVKMLERLHERFQMSEAQRIERSEERQREEQWQSANWEWSD